MSTNAMETTMDDYASFLAQKQVTCEPSGFAVDKSALNPALFPFQRDIVAWALRRGRAAIFADCGLGKTLMQLAWADAITKRTGRRALVLTPLAVGVQTVLEGQRFGIGATRSRDGSLSGERIIVTNYEQLHKFTASDFGAVVCDESSILKHYKGATQVAVTRFMAEVPFRLLCTATAAPNDYVELGTSSEALGGLTMLDMLSRYFKQDPKIHTLNERERRNKLALKGIRVDQRMMIAGTGASWRLKGHAVTPFWKWVASWARACRKPSDLGFSDDGFDLPELTQREHIIDPDTPPDGYLFPVAAWGLREERIERRRTMRERVALAATLVQEFDYSMVWCHLNTEGDALERAIPRSIQVSGSDDDDYKEAAVEWFKGDLCVCGDARFSARLTSWQRSDPQDTGSATTRSIESSDSQSPRTTIGNMAIDGEPTTQPITGPTPTSTRGRRNNKSGSTRPSAASTRVTLNFEKPPRLSSSDGKTPTQRNDSTNACDDTESQRQITGESSSHRAAAAPSAGARIQETGAVDGSTLTTATDPVTSADCSVPGATSGSESSETTQSDLSARPCTCGHRSGPRRLISKARIFGFGLNLQFCNHVVTFASHSYEQFYQSVRRCWRFGQARPVTVDIIATTGERHVIDNMQRKAVAAGLMFEELVRHMNEAAMGKAERGATQNMEVPSWL